MPFFERDGIRLHYDVEGDGYPVLLIALGGLRSANDLWANAPWNPREALVDQYRLIGMDQRNAGQSTAPISGEDGWSTYTADQLALLDHLEIEELHVVGMCIGGPYIMGLLNAAPERFRSAVMLQPVGIDGNRDAFYEMFEGWKEELAPNHPEASDADWAAFRSSMWDGDFVLTAARDQVAACTTPLLVTLGNDLYHPQSVSREIADLAPNATLVERWKEAEVLAGTDATIKAFLADNTP